VGKAVDRWVSLRGLLSTDRQLVQIRRGFSSAALISGVADLGIQRWANDMVGEGDGEGGGAQRFRRESIDVTSHHPGAASQRISLSLSLSLSLPLSPTILTFSLTLLPLEQLPC
jgi:hypothetical protein